jgi:flagellar hook-length control protein FliK
MTMQTNSLPFQVSGANALNGNNATQRNVSADKPAANANGGFGATFSRELAQRQQPQPAAPAPAPAPAQQAKPAQQGSKPAQADKPASREPAHQAAAKPAADSAPKTAKADSKGSAEKSGDAGDAAQAAEAAEAATTPVTDMLAFMASLQQPAANAAVATDAAAGGSAVEAQLTALENAMKNLKGSATGADGAAVTSDDSGAGLKLATGVVPAATDAVAARQDVALQGQDGQQDAAQFGAHLREAQQAVPAAAEEAAPPLAQLQAQAAKLAEVQNPAATGDRIPARVGTQAWDNQVSQRIVYMIGKEQAATLTLNPPDLGPVQVVLNVSNDQATVAFSSQQLEVRQALENAMPRLREMMSESGIALGNATVDAGAANQQGSQNGERRAEGGNANGGGNGLGGTGQGDVAVNEVAPRATRTVALGDRGMVDLFA